MMNINEIDKRLRQRPPFQMIERVTEMVAGESARGLKNVSVNEPYFVGHFPDAPIMPGVLIAEACAQLCSIVMSDTASDDGKLYVLLKIDSFKFVKPIIPGDTLDITVKKTRAGGSIVGFDATVCVNSTVCAKGALTFTAIDRDSVYADK